MVTATMYKLMHRVDTPCPVLQRASTSCPLLQMASEFSRLGLRWLVASSALSVDLEVQFAGQTARYQGVPFQLAVQGKEIHITGTVPATCSDFKIDRPSFLAVPIKNEIPVRVEMTWSQN